jgi:hypothetical protein
MNRITTFGTTFFGKCAAGALMLGMALVFAGCPSNTNDPAPVQETFSFKQGDYTVYTNTELNEQNNPTGTPYRSSRIIARTGLMLGGQNDAVLAIDSSFLPASQGGTRVDTTYYRVNNREVFTYLDAERAAALAGGAAMGGIRGFTPRWIKVAELNETAGSEFRDSLSVSVDIPGLGALPFVIRTVGRNQGRAMLMLDQNYAVYRQTQNISTSINLLGMAISFAVPGEVDFGGLAGSPRTILRTQTNSAQISLLGMLTPIPGSRSTMVSFRPGN